MAYSEPSGGGANKSDPVPACSKEYSPHSGGMEASPIESEGAPGEKGEGGMSAVTGNTEEGEYNYDKLRSWGNYPHSGPDPDNLEGPPIGSTDGGPTHAEGQSSPGGGGELNERIGKGF